jgi:hypothetical protein
VVKTTPSLREQVANRWSIKYDGEEKTEPDIGSVWEPGVLSRYSNYGLDDVRNQVSISGMERIVLYKVQTGCGAHSASNTMITCFLRVKRTGREADHSPPSIAEVKNC